MPVALVECHWRGGGLRGERRKKEVGNKYERDVLQASRSERPSECPNSGDRP